MTHRITGIILSGGKSVRMGQTSEIKDIIRARLEMKESVDYRNWECSKVYMGSV